MKTERVISPLGDGADGETEEQLRALHSDRDLNMTVTITAGVGAQGLSH